MFTLRNVLAVGVFLFGTTYLWLTPAFLPKGSAASGAIWMVVQVVAFATLLGFTFAAWGIFQATGWWEPVAIGSAILGMGAVIPYWVGATSLDAVNALVENIVLHVIGSAVVVVALLLPPFERWIAGRL